MTTSSPTLDLAFRALADPGRRQLLSRIAERPQTLSELAAPLPVSLAAVVHQVKQLEASGLVETRKVGRVRTCSLSPTGLSSVEEWVADQRRTWERRFDRLEVVLDRRAREAQEDQP